MKQRTAVRSTAQRIAEAINVNCANYDSAIITRETWNQRQLELWGKAEKAHVMVEVMRIVCPSLNASGATTV